MISNWDANFSLPVGGLGNIRRLVCSTIGGTPIAIKAVPQLSAFGFSLREVFPSIIASMIIGMKGFPAIEEF